MKIYVGQQTPEHKGDTSRELIDIWEEGGYCEVVRGEVEDVFVWANEPNDVLLYEYDRFDVYPGLPDSWNKGLFGGMQCDDPRALPWTYWARRLQGQISGSGRPLPNLSNTAIHVSNTAMHIHVFVYRTYLSMS